jgi:hypothetical protein
LVIPCIGQKETPTVRACHREPEAFPLLCRTVEAKKVLHPFSRRKDRLPVGSVEIDEEKSLPCNENVLQLKVAVEKTGLVKVSDEMADRSNGFPLRRKGFRGRVCPDLAEILSQILSIRDFHRKEISPVERKEDPMVDGADGGDRRNSTRSDFLR